MLPVLFGSHWTVTFLWAFSYCCVSCSRPALSAAVIAPVFGGSTALIVTDPLLPEPPGPEPPDVHPAASAQAASRTAPAAAPSVYGFFGTCNPTSW